MYLPQSIIDAIPTCHILIVDDDEMIRQFIDILLEGHGYKNLHHAENGWEALEIIKTTRLDCLILDINMPGMSGQDVMRHVRNSPSTEDLPILVVTAHDDRQERNDILNSGASNLISKPINQDLLLKRLSSLLERKLMIEKLSSYHERLSQELTLAARMQKGLIPPAETIDQIEKQYAVKLAHAFRP
ncbi:MAG: response regulator, partial [Magnetovibrio sp.]|nr:response regulator [Magnetovibrio sp.]